MDRWQAILHTEFNIDNATDVLASETADSIFWSRAGEHTFSQLYFFKLCEFPGSAGLPSWANRINSAVTVVVKVTIAGAGEYKHS